MFSIDSVCNYYFFKSPLSPLEVSFLLLEIVFFFAFFFCFLLFVALGRKFVSSLAYIGPVIGDLLFIPVMYNLFSITSCMKDRQIEGTTEWVPYVAPCPLQHIACPHAHSSLSLFSLFSDLWVVTVRSLVGIPRSIVIMSAWLHSL